jgi:PAS domain S-box-containing protein
MSKENRYFHFSITNWGMRKGMRLFVFVVFLLGVTHTKSWASTIFLLDIINYNNNTHELTMGLWLLILIVVALLALIFIITLVSNNKRLREIKHEQILMSSLIDNIPDNIYFKDLDSRFTKINKAQARILGLNNPADAIGKTDFDFFKHAKESFDIEQEIIRTRIPVINKVNQIEIDGQIRQYSDTKIPLIGVKGECIGTVGITHDITDLKLVEATMLENQAKFKALFENAPLAIFRLDKDMRVVEYNHRFRKMFGFSSTDDMTNISKYDLLADAEIGGLILDTVLETKEVNTEIMMRRKNGEQFIANLTLSLLEEGFTEISIEGIVEDITQMAKARDEIIKAKDKAVEADKLKSLFLANMSHEIRTPMNAIIGFTNMIKEEDLTHEERNSFIDVVQSNGNALMSLIDSIVDFSKLEADQMAVSLSEFNINPMIDSICDHVEKQLRTEDKTHIKTIKIIPSPNGVRITADRHRLYQVLNHLVSNAIKFTDNGEITIGYQHTGDNFRIFVRDTGIGIPENKLDVIFDRFTKIANDKNRLYGGTGIGLTISKGLIELMHGKISVESTLGEGSSFYIDLKI